MRLQLNTIKIGHKAIGAGEPTFVIAEAGMNHNSDPVLARKLVEGAARSGADAIKFQNYTADNLVTKTAPKYYADTMEQWERGDPSTGYQYDEFENLDKLPPDTYQEITALCRQMGLVFMSTPFDEESVDLLVDLKASAFKIASADITYLPFLEYVASKQLPVILSTGCSTIGEIDEALEVIYSTGNDKVILLHCTLSYPSKVSDANLNMMRQMMTIYPDIPIGLSDHTLGTLVPILAASHGATVIEKHYTIDKSLPDSTDHFMSVDPPELKQMVADIRSAESAMGISRKKVIPSENESRAYARRSLVAKTFIEKGAQITPDHLAFKRPGTGMAPKNINLFIGKTAKKDIQSDELLSFNLIS